MTSISKTNTKSGGCGCGGGGGMSITTATSCACSNAGCSSCDSQGFVRPRFFAGQLLTEEDLQLLTDYVTGKNRLRNRHMFGEGVVCGLDVSCQPCDTTGKVTVSGGYALDCCGNDITVPCPQELDINRMIRDLRRDQLGGQDCGDPCDQKTESGTGAMPAGQGSDVDITGQPVESIARHYCLYVRYCEEQTDPVSPYATDEPCGFQTCEPTRVREGFRFELRCRTEKRPHGDLLSRICMCIGDLVSAEKVSADMRGLNRYKAQASQALANIRANPAATFTKGDIEQMNASVVEMSKAIEDMGKSASEQTLFRALDTTRNVARYPARYLALDATGRQEFSKNAYDVRALRDASNRLGELKPLLNNALSAVKLPSLDSAYANANIETIDESLRDLNLFLSTQESGDNAATAAQPNPAQTQSTYRLRAEGLTITQGYQVEIVAALAALRETLLDRLDKSTHLTDCGLPRDLKSLSLPQGSNAGELSVAQTRALSDSVEKLSEALKRYFLGCLCAALNPPCPSCDDMGVLLACLEVKDCKVVNICNLERDFVLTAVALRYWFPLDRVGQFIEELCCPARRPGVAESIFLPGRGQKILGVSTDTALAEVRGKFSASSLANVFASVMSEVCTTSSEDKERLRRIAHLLFDDDGDSTRMIAERGASEALKPQNVAEAINNDSEVQTALGSVLSRHLDKRLVGDEPVIKSFVEEKLTATFASQGFQETLAEQLTAGPSRTALSHLVSEQLEGQMPTPEERQASISTVVDQRFAAMMASSDFKNRIAEVMSNGTVKVAFGGLVDQRWSERVPELREEMAASINLAFNERFASALASTDFKSTVIGVLNDASVREAMISALAQQLNEKMASLHNETAAFVATEMAQHSPPPAEVSRIGKMAEDVKALKSLKRSHANLVKKSLTMERRLKKLEEKETS